MNKVLELKGLYRAYPLSDGQSLEVLKGIDLDLYAGEIVGLIGPSGSGKSSLLHCLGLLEASKEAILRISDQDLTNASDELRTKTRRHDLGFVYQFHHLLPEYTALGNVILPQLMAGRSKSEAKARAHHLLAQMGLEARVEHMPGQLSGGEQQRVAIARALANKPKLLLADEPTGNLDPVTSSLVFEALKQISKTEGVATLIATHNLDLAEKMDRVLRLEQGKLVAL